MVPVMKQYADETGVLNGRFYLFMYFIEGIMNCVSRINISSDRIHGNGYFFDAVRGIVPGMVANHPVKNCIPAK